MRQLRATFVVITAFLVLIVQPAAHRIHALTNIVAPKILNVPLFLTVNAPSEQHVANDIDGISIAVPCV